MKGLKTGGLQHISNQKAEETSQSRWPETKKKSFRQKFLGNKEKSSINYVKR